MADPLWQRLLDEGYILEYQIRRLSPQSGTPLVAGEAPPLAPLEIRGSYADVLYDIRSVSFQATAETLELLEFEFAREVAIQIGHVRHQLNQDRQTIERRIAKIDRIVLFQVKDGQEILGPKKSRRVIR